MTEKNLCFHLDSMTALKKLNSTSINCSVIDDRSEFRTEVFNIKSGNPMNLVSENFNPSRTSGLGKTIGYYLGQKSYIVSGLLEDSSTGTIWSSNRCEPYIEVSVKNIHIIDETLLMFKASITLPIYLHVANRKTYGFVRLCNSSLQTLTILSSEFSCSHVLNAYSASSAMGKKTLFSFEMI